MNMFKWIVFTKIATEACAIIVAIFVCYLGGAGTFEKLETMVSQVFE